MNLVTVCNDTTITAIDIRTLLEQLKAQATVGVPVTCVLDNARYQHCKLVQQRAAELGIELLFLPPYSPNLNLIERLWKWVKKSCLRARLLESFSHFKTLITDCLTSRFAQARDELTSLLTSNFQSFMDVQIIKR